MGGLQKKAIKYFSRRPNLKERITAEGLKRNIEELPVIKHFFEGTLLAYLKTPASEKELEKLANDDKLFDEYREALRIPGATKSMAKYLQSEDGIESFIRVGKDESGLRVLVKLGQIPEGRKVARHMIASPLRGWPAMYRILKELGNFKRKEGDENVELPCFDLSRIMKSPDPVKELLPLFKDKENIGLVFISLSESDENAELCKEILKDRSVRKILFDYLTSGKTDPEDAFRTLFRSKKRRERISGIFMSSGGTKLLADLAGNVTGRAIMTNLAISGYGRNIGAKVLLKHPITIIQVGVNYFREPKN
jgi:hypothetical protein